jgi:predicted O-linked N-acetylglucosamine transferase (SPINDLY family)
MKPVFAVINRHDRQAFEIHMLCDDAPPSGGSGYADDPNDFVHDITGTSAERAAQIIADLELDVLVDLNGYSAQERLPVLMRKPARNIVGWFNMFATTGVQAFDWLVGDDIVVRRDEETFYGERIHRVPGTYLAFEILYPVPDLAPPPSVENGFLTFGCLGSHYKITEEVLDAWAAILRAARHTRLFIKNGALEDESVRNDLLERLTGRDVPADRISLSGRSEHYDFLDAYRYVDIALDTFPYNGGTTTTEALWQGVPVLTFYGDRWASRTSASLLSAAALDDWIRPDAQDYVRYAAMLGNSATAADMLAGLRLSMRQHLAQSGACDAERLCRDLEGFYQRICRRK